MSPGLPHNAAGGKCVQNGARGYKIYMETSQMSTSVHVKMGRRQNVNYIMSKRWVGEVGVGVMEAGGGKGVVGREVGGGICIVISK